MSSFAEGKDPRPLSTTFSPLSWSCLAKIQLPSTQSLNCEAKSLCRSPLFDNICRSSWPLKNDERISFLTTAFSRTPYISVVDRPSRNPNHCTFFSFEFSWLSACLHFCLLTSTFVQKSNTRIYGQVMAEIIPRSEKATDTELSASDNEAQPAPHAYKKRRDILPSFGDGKLMNHSKMVPQHNLQCRDLGSLQLPRTRHLGSQ